MNHLLLSALAYVMATSFAFKSDVSSPDASCQQTNRTSQPVAAAPQGPVIQSIDGGYSWENIGENLSPETWVTSLTPAPFGLVAGTENDGVYLRSHLTRQWIKIGGKSSFRTEKISGTFVSGGNLYVTVFQGGFFRYDPVPNTWKAMHEHLPNANAQALLSPDSAFVGGHQPNPIPNNVRAVLHYDNSLWVGTDQGIFQSLDEGVTWKQCYHEGQVTSLVENNGYLWAGTYRGLMRSEDEGRQWRYVFEDGTATRVKQLEKELVYVTMNGVARTTVNNGLSWHTVTQGFSANRYIFDLVKSGSDWLISSEEGLIRGTGSSFISPLVRLAQRNIYLQLEGNDKVIYAIRGNGGC